MVCLFYSFWRCFYLVKQAKFVVSNYFLENAWWNGLKFCMLMCPDHLQNWLDFVYGLLIFLLLASLWLSEMDQICGFLAFSWEHMEGMAWNFVCWCILTTFYSERPRGAGFRSVNPAERWRENPARALARAGFSQHLECGIHWSESSPEGSFALIPHLVARWGKTTSW